MSEEKKNTVKNLERYNHKFDNSPSSFKDYEAFDYVKSLKEQGKLDEAIEAGRTFLEQAPELKRYINPFGYALYNKYVDITDDEINANPQAFENACEEIFNMTKQERYSPYEVTVNKIVRHALSASPVDYAAMVKAIERLDMSLISDQPYTTKEGKEIESRKERFTRLKVRALYELKEYSKCLEAANIALTYALKWHNTNLEWLKYYRACSLVELERYDEAKAGFLQLQNRFRGVNFYEVLYKMYSNIDQNKEANTYLLYEFFVNGYDVSLIPMYRRLLEAVTKTGDEDLIAVVDAFLNNLCTENGKSYHRAVESTKYDETVSEELYDKVYEKVMNKLDLLVERKEGKITYYNEDKKFGRIAEGDNSVFFRQADYIYDEEVSRRDKVAYTTISTYDNKHNEVSSKAILIETTEEYMDFNFGY